MLLSLSGYHFEDNYSSQSVSFPEFCSIAKSAGYQGVELRRTQVNLETPVRERRDLLKIVQDTDLDVTCLTARGMPSSGPGRDDYLDRYLDLCVDYGCGLLKVTSASKWLRRAASKAERLGITLVTSNSADGVLETVEDTREFFTEVGHPNVGLLYDSLHLNIAGADYLGCIEEFFGITRNIMVQSVRHVRPGERVHMEKDGVQWTSALPDDPGVQDWPAIIRKFKQLGYDGPFTVIENKWPKDQRENVARACAETIQRMWSEVESRPVVEPGKLLENGWLDHQ